MRLISVVLTIGVVIFCLLTSMIDQLQVFPNYHETSQQISYEDMANGMVEVPENSLLNIAEFIIESAWTMVIILFETILKLLFIGPYLISKGMPTAMGLTINAILYMLYVYDFVSYKRGEVIY